MNVDRDAPVIAHASLPVTASVQDVWNTLADVDGWPSWNTAIRSARIDGDLQPGAVIRWRAGPGTIRSVVAAVERPRLLAWTGKTMGIHAVHVWRLEEADGATVATTEESWRGLLPKLMPGRMRARLQKSLDEGLAALKLEAEWREIQRRDAEWRDAELSTLEDSEVAISVPGAREAQTVGARQRET